MRVARPGGCFRDSRLVVPLAIGWIKSMFKNWRANPVEVDMSSGEIVDFLKYGIALEKQQVEFYEAASKAVLKKTGDEHLATALKRFSEVEADHLEKLARKIKEFREKPGALPLAAGLATGVTLGMATNLASPVDVFKATVWMEQKAIDHYLRVINGIQDPALREFFLTILVDEESHSAWAQERVEQARNSDEKDTF